MAEDLPQSVEGVGTQEEGLGVKVVPDPDKKDDSVPFRDLTRQQKLKRVFVDYIFMLCVFLVFLYLFVCALSIMGSAFQLLGGKDAGRSLSQNELFDNPIAGLVLGVLATVLLQSSSTTTSIVITMTAAELLTVEQGIYMVMGANIGTSVTNTIVAMGQIKDRAQFELAFAGATIHDMFNILTVCTLLPIEAATGYLRALTAVVVSSWDLETDKSQKKDLLKKLTKPLTDRIVRIDKNPIEKIAKGELSVSDARLLKYSCSTREVAANCSVAVTAPASMMNGPSNVTTTVSMMNGTSNVTATVSMMNNTSNVTATVTTTATAAATTTLNMSATTMAINTTTVADPTTIVSCVVEEKVPCDYLFHNTSLSESAVGAILLVCSLLILCLALVFMVKILTRLLKGQIAVSVKTFVNAEFPGKAAYFTGYVAILVGAGLTILVQSSSVFTSAITPLVGMGIIDLERMYPLTLGANLGTTVTGILAGLASSNVVPAMRVAMAHLFFNLTGIVIWYAVPFMRKPPIEAARFLGRTTFKYRWFALAYIIVAFFLIPLTIFGLSLAGWKVLLGVGAPVLVLVITVVIVKILQHKRPAALPTWLQDWKFLPKWMRSLQPVDRVFQLIVAQFDRLKVRCGRKGAQEKGCKDAEDSTQTETSFSRQDTTTTDFELYCNQELGT